MIATSERESPSKSLMREIRGARGSHRTAERVETAYFQWFEGYPIDGIKDTHRRGDAELWKRRLIVGAPMQEGRTVAIPAGGRTESRFVEDRFVEREGT
jgi:hypothetical protein